MTARLEARRITREQVAAVQRLMESNPRYSEHVVGIVPGEEAALEVLTALPPDTDIAQKVDLGLWDGDRLVALADVILGWPAPDVAHIGLLMSDGTRHGRGIGRRMHDAVLDMLGAYPRIRVLRLSVVDTNAETAEPFWKALGYRPTGEAVPYSSGSVESTARVWTRSQRRPRTFH